MRGCFLQGIFCRTRVVIDIIFVYHFVDPELELRYSLKEGAAEKGCDDFEIGD